MCVRIWCGYRKVGLELLCCWVLFTRLLLLRCLYRCNGLRVRLTKCLGVRSFSAGSRGLEERVNLEFINDYVLFYSRTNYHLCSIFRLLSGEKFFPKCCYIPNILIIVYVFDSPMFLEIIFFILNIFQFSYTLMLKIQICFQTIILVKRRYG